MSAGNLNGKGLNFSAVSGSVCGVVSATASSATTAITIPGLTTQSVPLVTLVNPDQTAATVIRYAVPTANTLTVTFSASTTAASTAKIAWWVPQY